MNTINKVTNHLEHETSPYLLQHKDNPVNWYPWGREAFEKAKKENKPVFLSIGYSTCHWCHVMAHESFEDQEVARLLNENFVSIKVDKEERPDIDSIYMSVCQAYTGSGGWPTSVFMTPDQKPFYAGTYFPKRTFMDLLEQIHKLWQTSKEKLIQSGDEAIRVLSQVPMKRNNNSNSQDLIETAIAQFQKTFDKDFGGFGDAPKFPTPHNLLFLMDYYRHTKNESILEMVEKTLLQMYKGGIFDHIGFGFSRYSTDKYYLVPHFEKMLYDNALLIMSYIEAYDITNKEIYRQVAEKTAEYILREMTSAEGGFFSAQDADSEGVEGKYYVFEPSEILELLGPEVGMQVNEYYGITEKGNFEGKSIPNLLHQNNLDFPMEQYLPQIRRYRQNRTTLHLDDKILTSWNSLMICAFAMLYRVTGEKKYLDTAKKTYSFIENNLCEADTLFVSYREGKRSGEGFLDDYAFLILAMLHLYEVSFEEHYLERAKALCEKVREDFGDKENGGFYLYGKNSEQLILKPKDTYDGAIPSGNSVLAYNFVKLWQITEEDIYEELSQQQLQFMADAANDYPRAYSFSLLANFLFLNPPPRIVCVSPKENEKFPLYSSIKVLEQEHQEYPLINNQTTYYICKNNSCLPPTNQLEDVL